MNPFSWLWQRSRTWRRLDAVVESLQHTNKKLGDEGGPLFTVQEGELRHPAPTGIYAEIADIKERLEDLEKIINMYWAPKPGRKV